ncbi:MAG: DinB family protein [Chloroflexota bacterium]
MVNLGSPYTKEELLTAFKVECKAVHYVFEAIDESTFFAAPPDVWSPADNLVHLIKSCSPVIKAMNVPRLLLRARFGKAQHPSTSLATVRTNYMAIAAEGRAVASGGYLPIVKEKSPAEKERILSKWAEKSEAIDKALTKWSEDDLEGYQLPHPLLGDLTMREILFFTLYHNLHHVNDVQRLLKQPESEWFTTE